MVLKKIKTRKSGSSRRRKSSTAGKILPPLDVRSNKQLKEFERRIKQGSLTFVLVWAPWCGHCDKFMPHFDEAANSPKRSVQAVKVEENMLPAVNKILTNNVNRNAKPLNVEGYPSIIVVDKQGNKVTDIEPVKDTSVMKKVMENAGPLSKNAGINEPDMTSLDTTTVDAIASANIGIPNTGLVSGERLRNIDLGEDELKGSIASVNTPKKIIKLNSIPINNIANTNVNTKINTKAKKNLEESLAPSTLNTFNAPKNEPIKIPSDIKKLSQEASEITSLATPLTPPNSRDDDIIPKKISGGRRDAHGGSLYSSLMRTTYTLAPTAALLATAAIVMKKTKKTKKTKRTVRKSVKTLRRRR